MLGPMKFMLRSAWPVPSTGETGPTGISKYVTSVKPSARNKSSATYCGAQQMLGFLISRSRVVSSGGSADAGAVRNPNTPAAPATVRPLTISRRVVMHSSLELPLELVEESPVGTLGDDL